MSILRKALLLEDGGVVSLVGAGGKTTLMFRIARELSEAREPVLTTTTTKMFMPSRDQACAMIIAGDPQEVLKQGRSRLGKALHVCAAKRYDASQGKLVGYEPEAIERLWRGELFQWIIVEADGASRRPLKAPAVHEPVVPGSSRWFIAVIGVDAVGKPLQEEWVFRAQRYSGITGLPVGEAITETSIAACVAHREGLMKGAPADALCMAFVNKVDHAGGLEAGRRIARLLRKTEPAQLQRVILGQALEEPPIVEYYDVNPSGESHG